MKINIYLILFAIFLIVLFGGAFTIRYYKTGEIFLNQMIGVAVGTVLLLATLIWRK